MQGADLLFSGLIFAAEGMLLLWVAVLLTAAILVFARPFCDSVIAALSPHRVVRFPIARSPDGEITR